MLTARVCSRRQRPAVDLLRPQPSSSSHFANHFGRTHTSRWNLTTFLPVRLRSLELTTDN